MSSNDKQRFRLPIDWLWTTFGDVCQQPQYGYTTKASSSGTLHLLRTTDITSGHIDWNTVPFCTVNPETPGKYLLEDGDIVISRAGSVGVSHLVKSPKQAVFASYLIRFHPLCNRNYFSCFLKSPFYWDSISETQLGIAIPNVNASKLKEVELPLAPLVEQQAIVAKIESLFSELDKGVAQLQTVQKQLQRYRQSVLKAAFEGKLTAQWRVEQQAAGTLPNAEDLLAKIKTEREARYQQQLSEWEQGIKDWEAAGREGKKPRRPTEIKDPSAITKNELMSKSSIPENWRWTKTGETFSVFVGATPSRRKQEYWGGSIPWISSGEVAFKDIRDTREKITDEGLSCTSTTVHPVGSVILGMIGEGKTRGQAAILQIEAAHNQNTAVIRVSETACLPQYTFFWLYKTYEQNRKIGSGNNQKALNRTRVQDLLFPLCPVSEQQQIVQKIESRFSVLDELEKAVDQGLKQAESLRQSILKKAFEGRLLSEAELAAVRSDPEYEPADKLLERIRAEREAVPAGKPGRGRKRKK